MWLALLVVMREKLVAHDVVECVLGLGPNLFYNSPALSVALIVVGVVYCFSRDAGPLRE